MSRPWSDSTKRMVAVGLLLLFALVLYRFNEIIPPVVIAFIIAYILTPVVDALQSRTRIPRGVCVLVVDLCALALLAVIPAIVAPALIAEVAAVDVDIRALTGTIDSRLSGAVTVGGLNIELQPLYGQLSSSLQSLISPLLSEGLFLLMDVAGALLWALFIFVVSMYLMRDWHRVMRYLREVVPPDYRHDAELLGKRVVGIWQSFFRGQIALSLVIATAVGVTMAVLGVSNALVLGLLAGLLEAVPNVGPVIASVPAIALALIRGSSWLPMPSFWFALLVAGAYVVIQQVENNYLVPRIIGGSVRLHAMVVLVGAIAGARLAGVLGIFLAAPVLATARVLLAYTYRKLLDLEPAVEPLAEAPVAADHAGSRAQRLVSRLNAGVDGLFRRH
jgi:predicted PurR-regulated permease PerM